MRSDKPLPQRLERGLADGELEVMAVARVVDFECGGWRTFCGEADPRRASGLFRRPAIRTRDAGDGDRDVRVTGAQGPGGHLAGDDFAHRSVSFEIAW